MKPPPWPRVEITIKNGTKVPAIAPLVISGSRATDIPGVLSSWFMERWKAGYTEWINPFNGKTVYVSFENVRVIVFWSKNPSPIITHLDIFGKCGILVLFQLTINDYEPEGYEPGIPPLDYRIATVRSLAQTIGKDRLFWRFDPLIITRETGAPELLARITRIGDRIADSVSRLTVSFFSPYISAVNKMRRRGIIPLEPSENDVETIGRGLAALKKRWSLDIATCAEKIDLSSYGILRGSCIDPEVLATAAGSDTALARFFGAVTPATLFEDTPLRRALKDRGQRPLCGCMISKDVGRYGTCTFGCVYCYARGGTAVRDAPVK